MTVAVFPGSFDPMTLGHVDVARRAMSFTDELIVAVGMNPSKRYMFTPEERLILARQSLEGCEGVRVEPMSGLLVDFCRNYQADVIIKGIRGAADYAAEEPMALMNRHLTGIETIFILADPVLAHISSSLVKDLAHHRAPIDDFVAPAAAQAITMRIKENR